MNTCLIGNDKFYLKFTDAYLVDESDPSLQILIEFLAYRIYGLYEGVNIPNVHLVYDRSRKIVGLASSAVSGRMAGGGRIAPERLAKMLSAGVYVDVLLANWDVIGTGSGNVIIDNDKATRIDPGGSLTFRAQGGRKGDKFNVSASELRTMLSSTSGGSGVVYAYADLREAADTFIGVDWNSIHNVIRDVDEEVSQELETRGMSELLSQWKADVGEIAVTLKKRHFEILRQIKFIDEV